MSRSSTAACGILFVGLAAMVAVLDIARSGWLLTTTTPTPQEAACEIVVEPGTWISYEPAEWIPSE